MKIHSASRTLAGLVAGLAFTVVCYAQTSSRITPPAAQRGAEGGRLSSAGSKVLPDPALLDGSKQPAEKKSEYGMIGDFEMPGDENVRNGKVGGSSGGEGQQPPDPNAKQAAGTGSPAGEQGQKGQAANPAGGPQGEMPAAQTAGGAAPIQTGEKPGGAGDPNAQAQEMQVAEIVGQPTGMPAGAGADQKPGAVSIGDKAMVIPQSNTGMAGVIGAQKPAGVNTQVYEKPTGTGGKAPTGQQGPNRTEKGRAIPAGL